jgi:hypothetical protein
MSKHERHCCPACGNGLGSEHVGTPLRCECCGWYLVTLAEWKQFTPFQQGYTLYMQGSWPTSELAREVNPYVKESPEWTKFNCGEERALLAVQDGEE